MGINSVNMRERERERDRKEKEVKKKIGRENGESKRKFHATNEHFPELIKLQIHSTLLPVIVFL
jgi:hypothetical protein